MIKILVCDDNESELKEVNNLLSDWSREHNVDFSVDLKTTGCFAMLDEVKYDIAFLDVEMPFVDGLRLAEKLKEYNPDILIFVITAFQNYLDSAMKIKVFRYLIKPLDVNRFNSNLFDAVCEYRNNSKNIVIEQKDNVFFLKTKYILYIENLRYGSLIVTTDAQYKTNKKLKYWYDVINQPECFVYSHNSYLVNLQNVISFNKTTVSMGRKNNEIVTAHISQRKYSSFKKSFFEYAGGLI